MQKNDLCYQMHQKWGDNVMKACPSIQWALVWPSINTVWPYISSYTYVLDVISLLLHLNLIETFLSLHIILYNFESITIVISARSVSIWKILFSKGQFTQAQLLWKTVERKCDTKLVAWCSRVWHSEPMFRAKCDTTRLSRRPAWHHWL